MADHSVASQLETPLCDGENENENSKHGTDDQHISYIKENSSEIKVEPLNLEPTTFFNPQHKVIKIKFNPFSEIRHTHKSIQIENKHPQLEADIRPKSVMIIKKTYNKRAKEEFERGLDKVAVSKGHFVRVAEGRQTTGISSEKSSQSAALGPQTTGISSEKSSQSAAQGPQTTGGKKRFGLENPK
ncbi:Uncharacterized protein TCM_012355 [Theobroma cacao]|uniref:Uncharacterized protein n=1 Tax=Theobroma cacao TaxID=3641 RepID=A0A061FVX9_THECC|nr:Uncharacterized protein TCM_012355 [Theobroma cacao]